METKQNHIDEIEEWLDDEFDIDTEIHNTRSSKKIFWSYLYQQRPNKKILTFLNGSKEFSMITGAYGTGKTTCLRQLIEESSSSSWPECGGVIIDLTELSKDLLKKLNNIKLDRDDEYLVKAKNLVHARIDRKIGKEIKANLVEHFSICVKNKLPFTKWRAHDYCNSVCNESIRGLSQAENNYYENEATNALAAMICICADRRFIIEDNPTGEDIKYIRSLFRLKQARSHKHQYRIAYNFIKKNEKLADKITKVTASKKYPQLADYWMHVYMHIIKKKTILAFDNCDALANYEIISLVYDYAVGLAATSPEHKCHRKLKIMLAVRDENIPAPQRLDQNRRKAKPIVLADVPFGKTLSRDAVGIKLTSKLVARIVNKRRRGIAYIHKEQLEDPGWDRDWKYVVECINKTVLSLRPGKREKKLPLQYIVNESIRLALEFIRKSGICVARHYMSKGQFKINQSSARSLLLQWLFDNDLTMPQVLNLVSGEINQVQSGRHLCCTHRVILNYLYKKQAEAPYHATFQELSRIVKSFKIPKKTLVEALESLASKAGDEQDRDFVVVDYAASKDKYSAKTTIFITQRGVAFLESLSISYEYWRILSIGNGGEFQDIYHLRPSEFIAQSSMIAKYTLNHAVRHIRNWKLLCMHNQKVFGRTLPFDWYCENYTNYRVFSMERVCHSHLGALQNYLEFHIPAIRKTPSLVMQRAIDEPLTEMLNVYWHEMGDFLGDGDHYARYRGIRNVALGYLRALNHFARLKNLDAGKMRRFLCPKKFI